jgi:hypothetical protein
MIEVADVGRSHNTKNEYIKRDKQKYYVRSQKMFI